MKDQRDFVDRFNVFCSDDLVHCKVTKQAYLCLDLFGQEPIRATKQYVRLDTDAAQFFDTVLRWLCLDLSGRGYVWDQSQVNIEHIFLAYICLELPDRFLKGEALYVPNSASYFNDDHIDVLCH